jgi:putative two-component system response regulator
MSYEDALKIISDGHDTQFDPVVTEAVLKIQDKFKQIAEEYK